MRRILPYPWDLVAVAFGLGWTLRAALARVRRCTDLPPGAPDRSGDR